MYCRCVSLHRVFTNLAGTYCMLQVLMEGQLSTILIQVPKEGGGKLWAVLKFAEILCKMHILCKNRIYFVL